MRLSKEFAAGLALSLAAAGCMGDSPEHPARSVSPQSLKVGQTVCAYFDASFPGSTYTDGYFQDQMTISRAPYHATPETMANYENRTDIHVGDWVFEVTDKGRSFDDLPIEKTDVMAANTFWPGIDAPDGFKLISGDLPAYIVNGECE